MFGNFSFMLTVIVYIILTIFNLQKVTATGERLMGWGLIAFVLLAAYVVCSLILTISITAKGGFNWISEITSTRNIIIGIGWLCLMASVVICTMIKLESHTFSSEKTMPAWMIPLHYGFIWMPLLMLIPYAILLNPEWRDTLSPNFYKIPLAISSLIGFALFIGAYQLRHRSSTKEYKSEQQLANDRYLSEINDGRGLQDLLHYTLTWADPSIREAALNKIKSNKNWETDLQKLLDVPEARSLVYGFLRYQEVEHLDQFLEPLNRSIHLTANELEAAIAKSTEEQERFLPYMDFETLFQVIATKFKGNQAIFRPNMLKFQKVLEMPPLHAYSHKRNLYRDKIKNWLDTNQ